MINVDYKLWSLREVQTDKEIIMDDILPDLEALKPGLAGHFGFYIYLSQLKPHNKQPYYIRPAMQKLEGMLKDKQSSIFNLANGDAVIIAGDLNQPMADQIMQRLKMFLPNDPLTKQVSLDGRQFYQLYNLGMDYEAFKSDLEEVAASDQTQINFRHVDENGEEIDVYTSQASLDVLVLLERALKQADVSNFLRRQPICFVEESMEASPLSMEYYLSIQDIEKTLKTECDIQSNVWLFRHLTGILDKRMLPRVLESIKVGKQQIYNINLSLPSVLGRSFHQFHNAVKGLQKSITIEIDMLEILANPSGFDFIRGYLKDRGYMVCIDCVPYSAHNLVDLSQLDYDQIKLIWSDEFVEGLLGGGRKQFARWLNKHDVEKAVLCRCDQENGLEIAMSLGIHKFQGRLIESMLHKQRKQQTEKSLA